MWNDSTSDFTSKYQPSTKTNSSILNGNDTITGGNIIIPIDINTDATTMSITRKGTNRTKAIWKAVNPRTGRRIGSDQ